MACVWRVLTGNIYQRWGKHVSTKLISSFGITKKKKQFQKSLILLLSSSYKRFSIYPKKKVLQVVQVAQVVSYFLFTFCWQLFCTTKLSLKLQIGRHCYTLLLITHFYYFYSKVPRCFFKAVCKGVPILVQHIIRKWRFRSTRGNSLNPSYT